MHSLSDLPPGFKNGMDMDSKLAATQDLGSNSVLQQEIPWINYGLCKKKPKKKIQTTSQACILKKKIVHRVKSVFFQCLTVFFQSIDFLFALVLL